MITTFNNESKSILVGLHIGRGGRFNNAGHKDFMPYVSRLQDCYKEDCFTIDEKSIEKHYDDFCWPIL